jgi:hypothetical protein
MRPWERCLNLFVPYLQQLALRPSLRRLNALREMRKLKPLPSSHFDLWAQNLFISTASFGLEYARPLPSTVELVGPVLQQGEQVCSGSSSSQQQKAAAGGGSGPASPSDGATEEDVEQWLRHVGEDVLLVSGCGSFSAAQREVVAEALIALGRPVLWVGAVARRLKARSPLFRKFAPSESGTAGACHTRFTAHPAVALVFSHCDVHEAHGVVLAGKPSICMPASATQLDTAARLRDVGAALVIPLGGVIKRSGPGGRSALVGTAPLLGLEAAIAEALQRQGQMAKSVRYLSRTMSAAGGVKRAAQLVDTTLALGMAHLRPPPMPWYTNSCLDLYCAGACIVVACLLCLRVIVCLYTLMMRWC